MYIVPEPVALLATGPESATEPLAVYEPIPEPSAYIQLNLS